MKAALIVCTLIVLSLPLLFVRFGAPRPYDIGQAAVLKDGAFAIRLPIKRESIVTGFYLDGGSIGIGFRDDTDKQYMLWLDNSLGSSMRYKDVRLGEYDAHHRPAYVVSEPALFNAVAYSLMLSKQDCRELMIRYPCGYDYVHMMCRAFCEYLTSLL